MSVSRRTLLRGLSTYVLLLAGWHTKEAQSDMPDSDWLRDAKEKMKRATEEHALRVERLYSTKPITVLFGERKYIIPANHFSEIGADKPDEITVKSSFGFVLFLPDFTGFTKENWRDGWFDRRRIDVQQA